MIKYGLEVLRRTDLLFWLAAKEIKVRYKLPLLGFLWALLVPLLLSLILWIVFSHVVVVPMARCPYFLFLIVAMFPWNFFMQSVSNATMSVLESGSLIKKAVFPRMIIPLSVVAANGFNFLLTLIVVMGVVIVSRHGLSPWLWLLPVVVGLELCFTIGAVLVVAGLQVRYRDVKYLTEVSLLLWFYMTPIFYSSDLVLRSPRLLQWFYGLNPLVYLIELYRLVFLGEAASATVVSPLLALGIAAATSVGMLLIGILVFRQHEPTFADWVTG